MPLLNPSRTVSQPERSTGFLLKKQILGPCDPPLEDLKGSAQRRPAHNFHLNRA